ncbi:MAG: WYL domain-containing protein [Treponemataceae bacterium]|nr:MAG: WYL domain-containing protein [Treponemataceae bacterium]
MTDKAQKLNRSALPRIYFIDRKIASGTYPNTTDLAGEYETSIATISRDLEFMRVMLNAPIEYDYLHKGYYYTEDSFRLPAGFAGPEDLLALGMAQNLLAPFAGTPIYESARQLLDIITAPITDAARWFENRVIVPSIPAFPIAPGLWQTLCDSLRENSVITFDYKGAWDSESYPRRVHPWQLLFDSANGVWYLTAYSVEREALRVFSLIRMKNVCLTDETFTLPDDYDYRKRNSGESFFGVYEGEKMFDFEIELYGEAAIAEKEHIMAKNQTVTDTAEGALMRFSSSQYHKVLEWALAKGMNACPLAPPELVADWKAHVAGMSKMARGIA